MTTDTINGLYEGLGALMVAYNCLRLYWDKEVKGVSILPTTFFMTWGWWNLIFYPSVGAWFSFYGSIALVSVNTLWLGQMVYYSYLTKRCSRSKSSPTRSTRSVTA